MIPTFQPPPKPSWGDHIAFQTKRRMIELIANGFPRKAVADDVGMSEKGVDYHLANLKADLGLQSIADIVHYGIYHRIVPVKRFDAKLPPDAPEGRHRAVVCGYYKCGKTFVTKNGKQKYCCPNHCILAIALRRRAKEVVIRTAKCKHCGRSFRTTHSQQVYHNLRCKRQANSLRWHRKQRNQANKHKQRKGSHGSTD